MEIDDHCIPPKMDHSNLYRLCTNTAVECLQNHLMFVVDSMICTDPERGSVHVCTFLIYNGRSGFHQERESGLPLSQKTENQGW